MSTPNPTQLDVTLRGIQLQLDDARAELRKAKATYFSTPDGSPEHILALAAMMDLAELVDKLSRVPQPSLAEVRR